MSEIATECLAFAEDLSALIDAELADVRESEVRAHVATCAACAERLQELGNVDLEAGRQAQCLERVHR